MRADDAPAWYRRVGGLARRGVRFELRLYRSLLRWVARRPAVPAAR